MKTNKDIFDVIKGMSLSGLTRIDAALEGNWSPTVTVIWSKKEGSIGFSKMEKSHRVFKPSIELYFRNHWLGIHCFRRVKNKNIFDEKLATDIIDFVNKKLKSARER